MNTEPNKELGKIANNFPFLMVITSVFLSGSVFILLNLPLIILIINKTQIDNFYNFFKLGIYEIWVSAIKSSNNLSSISIFLLFSLIIGVTLTPLERGFCYLNVKLIYYVNRIFKRKKYKSNLFSPSDMKSSNYVPLLAWFFNNPGAKLNWEWHLFYYYIYWSFATNFLTFFILSVFILRNALTAILFLGLLIIPSLFLFSALSHSQLMKKVHNFYLINMKENKV